MVLHAGKVRIEIAQHFAVRRVQNALVQARL